MVSGLWCHLQAAAWALLESEEPGKSMLERLDPATRGRLLMALFGLAMLGVGLILLVMMGGHLVRRLSREPGKTGKPGGKAWYQKPLETDDDEHGEDEDGDEGDEEAEDGPRDNA